jgi:plasmid stabilization system protein ParE
MKRVIRISEKAENDLPLCSRYIAQENHDVVFRFLEAFEKTKNHLLRMPKMGRARNFGNTKLVGLREFPFVGFGKYLIF